MFVMPVVENVVLKLTEFKLEISVLKAGWRQLGKIDFKFLEQKELDDETMFSSQKVRSYIWLVFF